MAGCAAVQQNGDARAPRHALWSQGMYTHTHTHTHTHSEREREREGMLSGLKASSIEKNLALNLDTELTNGVVRAKL